MDDDSNHITVFFSEKCILIDTRLLLMNNAKIIERFF